MKTHGNKKTVFLTGATGSLGSYLLKTLLKNGHKVYALGRKKNGKKAEERIGDILKFWDDKTYSQFRGNLKIIEGDIIEKDFGINKKIRGLLKNEVEEVFHSAAITDFNCPLDKIRKVNVDGTKRLLDLSLEISKNGKLDKINYISTAFISGKHKGSFKEVDFDLNQEFNNNYEKSKFEAEAIVREYLNQDFRILIFRPSILVGEYYSGKTIDFKMFYEPLRLFSLEIIEKIPLDKQTFLNIMPLDLAATVIYILHNAADKNDIFHITCPTAFSINHIITASSAFFRFKKPEYVDLKEYKKAKYSSVARKILNTYIPYFNFLTLFNSDKTQATLKTACGFHYPMFNDIFLMRLFKYANQMNFINFNCLLKRHG